jgi:hypothetical protein
MPASPRFDDEERRRRLVLRHHIAKPAGSGEAVAGDLVGLHSSDPATVFLSARARIKGFRAEHLEDALYDTKNLGRVLGMRRTMFVLPVELIPVVHAACTRALAAAERRRLVKMVEEAGLVKDAERWVKKTEAATLEALRDMGEATATELSDRVPALKKKVHVGIGTKWEQMIGLTTRILFLLATDAKVVRGRPRGSWLSTQYRWAPTETWLGIDPESMTTEDACTELVRAWLAAYGPATMEDLMWWTGWTKRLTVQALDGAGAIEVRLEGSTGYVLPDDIASAKPSKPTARFLPALDPTTMGWKERAWYLGDHKAALFDRNGNAGPTIWWDGRIVGGWAQLASGEIVHRMLADAGSEAATSIEKEAEAVQMWLGNVRFIPRFRTPLEQELTR